ncbi:MAG: DUF4062 domain-containing protein, partial [Microcystis sp. M04BS1]|nr:DUF4062 domain-containing protein [Microcystis sp. M04BS1]
MEVHVGDKNIYSTPSPKRALIFISSVVDELQQERQVLEATLEKLAEVYSGIEYLCSNPNQSLEERIGKIQESALYIGLFGDSYGLIDELTQKPFIELEYDEAKSHKGLPKNKLCLIYFKKSQFSNRQEIQDSNNSNYESFKRSLLENQAVNYFANIEELERVFIVDFIQALRVVLHEQLEFNKTNAVSLDTLQLLCQATISEQIKIVARDKYICEIYIERQVEQEIDKFVNFDTTFLEKTDKIIDDLLQISRNYYLPEASNYLSNAKVVMRDSQTPKKYYHFIDELKKLFYFNQVEAIVDLINSTVRLSIERTSIVRSNLIQLDSLLRKLPFVTKEALLDFSDDLFKSWRAAFAKSDSPPSPNLKILPSKLYYQENKRKLANDLIKELNLLVQIQLQKCAVLVSNAGYGKTNVICRIADKLSKSYPVVLLSGQMESNSQYDIEYHLQRQLELFLPGSFANWVNRIQPVSKNTNRQWLFILIDGINENSNLPLFVRLLRGFIDKIEGKRIKLILSCRNLFWDLFSANLKESLFENRILELNEFTQQEENQAIQLYFNRFKIQANFDTSNISSLRNPLLLRFFCEAYREREIAKVSNIELLSVFDLYLERIEAKINEQLGLLRSGQIIQFLTKLSYQMWETRRTNISLSEIHITPEEVSKITSIYNLIRSENIIFEESLQIYASQKNVRFLYDEFMEYIIARSWVENLITSQELEQATEIILQQAVSALSGFAPAFGAILFLDKMLNRGGVLVSRAIALIASLEDEFVASRQITMLSAFKNIDIENISDELLLALDKFERIARDEIKEELAPIMIQILRQYPHHPITKEMIVRMLEVSESNSNTFGLSDQKEELQKIIDNCDTNQESSGTQSLKDKKEKAAKIQLIKEELEQLEKQLNELELQIKETKDTSELSHLRLQKQRLREEEAKLNAELDGLDPPLLPPGRYHYDEETRLNAISILVSSKDTQDFNLIEEGIKNLGKTEIHSALQALSSLDLASDKLVYNMIAKYYNLESLEYRIYCAWLLRKRYG